MYPSQDTRKGRRRQDRQDFFPFFSDSHFDSFLGGNPGGLSESVDPSFGTTSPHKQRQLRQQRQQQQQQDEWEQKQHEWEQKQHEWEQKQQLYEQQQLREQELAREYQRQEAALRRQHPKDRHEQSEPFYEPSQALDRSPHQYTQYRPQHHQSWQHQQWRPGQQPHNSKRHGRRQRRHESQEIMFDEAPSVQMPEDDEMGSLVRTAFGDDTESVDVVSTHKKPIEMYPPPGSITTRHTAESEPASTSEEPEEHDQHKEEEVATSDEEEQFPVDRELQRRRQADLSQIETSLKELSQELDQILAGQISNKKSILMTEENLTKAMLRIDAIESGGDSSIRKQRKDLINWAEKLLVKVDEFKRKTKTSAYSPNHH
ncbi:hypothetical protein BGZ65_005790 [Modicella reniformis]|uniref:BAG domain-containing protein n=1 Tax=Modicella reniformis TaxID=1440133 RepID=A0A9P6J5S1_9FUNG|nr:hypothetical protein BGZ65_005790 [Modicella reniformis]